MSQLEERFSQPEYWEELISFCVGLKLRGFKKMADRSRMNREVHVRFCEGLGVKFPWATRQKMALLLLF
jgi:hypothetical protein